jgi:glycosyltransferase involved in cell wall biosynthesis
MTTPIRIAFIGNSLPRRCGIATFTSDLEQSIAMSQPGSEHLICAMSDRSHPYAYPPVVRVIVRDDSLEDYVRAAETLNAWRADVVCLQHEFGIFGGESGAHVLALLSRLTMPLVTTLHTVLADPSPTQRQVLVEIAGRSSRVVVMAEKGRELLVSVYGVDAGKIALIPHGIPDAPFAGTAAAKSRLGFSGMPTILTFGLLSRNKGIEVMIDAMPAVLSRNPGAMYVVLGATHPNLVRDQGEAYRDSLEARVRARGVDNHVVFLDRFVDRETLLDFISMCDVYVTPYLTESQMTSGTLAYSFGMGSAVVSTPYWHARELLADGQGIIVPFGDSATLGEEIAGLLSDDARRESMRQRAYQSGRAMTWETVARRYSALFNQVRHDGTPRMSAVPKGPSRLITRPPPRPKLDHLQHMCDDTGLLQHAIHSVPDRLHGYCVDDNARALLLASALNVPGEQPMSEELCGRFAAFLQHAWNVDRKRFRNFMSFDRRWLEETGSEDSHGRALWALGDCARNDTSPARRTWADALFLEGLPASERFSSPRAWAFTLLGLDAYCDTATPHREASMMRHRLAERLLTLLSTVETDSWVWFEESLSYENARLPQALILTGIGTGVPSYIAAGLRTLKWLMVLQTSPDGCYRPVGSQSFGRERSAPQPFDQQPLEATATISACRAAWRVESNLRWRTDALRAFGWFLGSNDLSICMADVESGSCSDGLHPDRANQNRGGESVVSWLLALVEIRALYRSGNRRVMSPALGEMHASFGNAPRTH